MSVLGLFNVGLSGLETSNELLQVTGNNVANAQTPDYTRETANLATVPSGSISTTGSAGDGVQVTQVTRAFNSFVNAQVNTENSNVSYWNNYNTAITQVQDIFNEASSAGISPAITTFFNDWQNVAQSPQNDAQRTTLISDANNLSTSLNTAATSLNSVSDQLLTNSQTLTAQVNTITAQIATLNGELAGNSGSLALQDQRDSLVNQLNGLIKVSSYQDPGSGMYSVMVGGTPLVEDGAAYKMSVATDSSNIMHFYVGIAPNAGTKLNPQGSAGDPDVTSLITGGELASNIDLRNTKIPGYMKQLNAFAVDLADTTNYNQTQGYGLDGSTGTNFFQPLSQLSKYTSVDSVNGVFTSAGDTFSTGGTLSIKLGDNDTSPATVLVAAGSTLQQTVVDINAQAGSKVTASVVNTGPVTQFTVNAANNTFKTNLGSGNILAGTYTGANLASAINALGLGVNVTFNTAANDFTINSTGGPGGASNVDAATTIGDLTGFNFSGSPAIGPGITGTVPDDYRISIQSNPAGNLGNVRIGVVATADVAGSGLNLLATSPILSNNTPGAPGAVISSVNVADSTQTVANAQYNIDYISAASYGLLSAADQAAYQEENAGGTPTYWRVMESTDGSKWTAIDPGEVNLSADPSGLTRTLEFQGVKIQIDGSGISTTNPSGGTFNVRLDPNAALDMATTITDPNQVAASTDNFTVDSTNNSVVFNVNGAPTNITTTIPQGSYTPDTLAAALTTAIQSASGVSDTLNVTFNPNTKQFNIIKTSGNNPIQFQWGGSTSRAIFGFSSASSPTITNPGDSAASDNPASVEANATNGLPGDNTNANTIANLANGNKFAGTTPTDFYMSLVSNIGVDASSANTNQQYHSSLLSELNQQQQQVSGVSMDEEASNLVIYQKSYEAAAQLITVANQMLATLLQMVK